MNLNETIRRELQNARRSQHEGNPGRARVCARRAVSAALNELAHNEGDAPMGNDAMKLLGDFLGRPFLPVEVVAAGGRLRARAHSDFTSPSGDPGSEA